MSTSTVDDQRALARDVSVNDHTLTVDLLDGRTIAVPLGWYPRLKHGSQLERDNWRLIGQGSGIHWPDLDEDISVSGLLAGRDSKESQASLARWLKQRESPDEAAHSTLASLPEILKSEADRIDSDHGA
jgi:hypothetical protein